MNVVKIKRANGQSDPTYATTLLLAASARYQNYLIEEIEKLYKNDDFFKQDKLSDEDIKRKIQISDLIKKYGKVYELDTRYRYGAKLDDKVKTKETSIVDLITESLKKVAEQAQKQIVGVDYSYCGSGTPIFDHLSNGVVPVTKVDFYCMLHDLQYVTAGAARPDVKRSRDTALDREMILKERDIMVKNGDKNLTSKIAALLDELGDNPRGNAKALKQSAEVVGSAMKFKNSAAGLAIRPSSYIDVYKNSPTVIKPNGKALFTTLEESKESELSKEGVVSIDGFSETLQFLGALGPNPTFLMNSVNTKGYTEQKESEEKMVGLFVKDKPKVLMEIQDLAELVGNRPLTSSGARVEYDFPIDQSDADELRSKRERGELPGGPGEDPPEFLRIDSEEEEEATAGRALAVEEGAGEERKEEEPEEEGERLIDPSDPVKPEGGVTETPVDVAGVIGQRDNVGQEERVDIKADPPMSAMAMTDAKPVVGERNMRPTLFREEGDTVELSRKQDQENRLFYENFTWIDAGFGNGNIQRVPNQNYAGGDIANNRLYTAQVKNEMLKYSGDLFVGSQQHRKKYNISANTRNLVRRPMHSTVQHHQQFIRDSSLPAGAGRKHQMARDNPSWMPSKNVNSRVGHLYYPDVVDGQRL